MSDIKECSICLNDITELIILNCNHEFCKQCLIAHIIQKLNMRIKATCPSCRSYIEILTMLEVDDDLAQLAFANKQIDSNHTDSWRVISATADSWRIISATEDSLQQLMNNVPIQSLTTEQNYEFMSFVLDYGSRLHSHVTDTGRLLQHFNQDISLIQSQTNLNNYMHVVNAYVENNFDIVNTIMDLIE